MRLSKQELMPKDDGGVNGIIEINDKLTLPVCKNIMPPKIWVRVCPDCGKNIVYNYASNFYTARSRNTLLKNT